MKVSMGTMAPLLCSSVLVVINHSNAQAPPMKSAFSHFQQNFFWRHLVAIVLLDTTTTATTTTTKFKSTLQILKHNVSLQASGILHHLPENNAWTT